MRALLDRLGNPQDKLHIVHVAGTKGKGSTSAMIAAMLKAAGYRTGLFTSPHLDRVEERIAIDGQPCTADEFASLSCRSSAGGRRILIVRLTACAIQANMDRLILKFLLPWHCCTLYAKMCRLRCWKSGLGGRLDSTNVCRPLVSVITSISFDHLHAIGRHFGVHRPGKSGNYQAGRAGRQRRNGREPREDNSPDRQKLRLPAGGIRRRFSL